MSVNLTIKLIQRIVPIICVFITLIGCNQTPTVDTQAEAEKIRQIDREYDAAVRAKDLEKSMSYYAANVFQMPPDAPALRGYGEIYKVNKYFLENPNFLFSTFAPDTIEVAASGELAYDRGTSRLIIKTPKGRIENVGKYVAIWKKIDGQWKITEEIFNYDKPWASLKP